MDIMIIVFVGAMCAYVAAKIFSSEERTEVFNKYKIQVKDVKAYNKFCGKLVVAFGVVAEITLIIGVAFGGWISLICTILMILEAVACLKYYAKKEKEMLVERK